MKVSQYRGRATARREPGWLPLAEAILTGHPGLTGAACSGRSELFDAAARDETDEDRDYRHARAVTICRGCPVVDACREWADGQRDLDDTVVGGRAPTVSRPGRPPKEAA